MYIHKIMKHELERVVMHICSQLHMPTLLSSGIPHDNGNYDNGNHDTGTCDNGKVPWKQVLKQLSDSIKPNTLY